MFVRGVQRDPKEKSMTMLKTFILDIGLYSYSYSYSCVFLYQQL
jgi:hypothetical protein